MSAMGIQWGDHSSGQLRSILSQWYDRSTRCGPFLACRALLEDYIHRCSNVRFGSTKIESPRGEVDGFRETSRRLWTAITKPLQFVTSANPTIPERVPWVLQVRFSCTAPRRGEWTLPETVVGWPRGLISVSIPILRDGQLVASED